MENIDYGSVCSGIESASVAWEPLGWKPAWFAEIEAFPCAVLAHRWPHVKNLGDMTEVAAMVRAGHVVAPAVLVGGTPCQAFSVAGARAGLADPRGQLTLAYVDLANAIDTARTLRGEPECITCWENVPGVLSMSDNAFGCFLGALAGEDSALEPPGGKWKDAGVVYGPQRAIAWRILDAQFFGLAQRRRRVFVVSSAREGFDPALVLFEFEGLRRDSPPSREAKQDVAGTIAGGARRSGGYSADDIPAVASTLTASNGGISEKDGIDGRVVACLDANYGRLQGCSGQDMNHAHSTLVVAPPVQRSTERPRGDGGDPLILAYGGNNTQGPIDVATARNACASGSGRLDFESETFVVHGTQDPCVMDDQAFALGRNNGQENAVLYASNLAPCLRAGNHFNNSDAGMEAQMLVAVNQDCREVAATIGQRMRGQDDSCANNLIPIAFSCKDHGADAADDLAPTLRAMGHGESHANAGGQVAVVYRVHAENSNAMLGDGDAQVAAEVEVARCLDTTGGYSHNQGGNVVLQEAPCVAYSVRTANTSSNGCGIQEEVSHTLDCTSGPAVCVTGDPVVAFQSSQSGVRLGDTHATLDANNGPRRHNGVLQGMAVRRLMPRECERLQGFEDDYTLIPIKKGKPKLRRKLKSSMSVYESMEAALQDMSGAETEEPRFAVALRDDYFQVYAMAADGPRYKALGNSKAVPVIRWIGRRIDVALSAAPST